MANLCLRRVKEFSGLSGGGSLGQAKWKIGGFMGKAVLNLGCPWEIYQFGR
jgi:hypothetical protein